MKRIFQWLRSHLIMDEPPPPAFEAGAITTRLGDKRSDGLSEWKVVLQLRHPTADYDAVYTIRYIMTNPPDVEQILNHYSEHPQNFTFVDFLPNPNKPSDS